MSIWTPDGQELEPRAKLPTESLKLSDGRILKFLGHLADHVPAGIPVPPDALIWGTQNGMRVIGSIDETQHGRLLHVSVSYTNRDPPWSEIVSVRDAFYPDDIDVMMILPKKADYINVHKHTFHLQQTPIAWNCQ